MGLTTEVVAQEPVEPGADQDEGAEVIDVWGRPQTVLQAREDLVQSARDFGYDVIRKNDGSIVFTPNVTWKGRVKLLPSGIIHYRKPQLKWAPKKGPLAFHMTHPHKLEAANRRFGEAVHADLVALQEALARDALLEHLNDLPSRLTALWERGDSLDGGPHLATLPERRRAMLAYWGTRRDTDEGFRVQRLVEAWIIDHVQATDDPVTPDEIAWAHSLRDDDRVLHLGLPPPSP